MLSVSPRRPRRYSGSQSARRRWERFASSISAAIMFSAQVGSRRFAMQDLNLGLNPFGARRVLDALEGPVEREPFTHDDARIAVP